MNQMERYHITEAPISGDEGEWVQWKDVEALEIENVGLKQRISEMEAERRVVDDFLVRLTKAFKT